MRPWHQEVAAQLAGITVPLLTLSAACLGTQLTLSSENLPFGTVVLGSKVLHSSSGALGLPCLVLSALYGGTCTPCILPGAASQQNSMVVCTSTCLAAWTVGQSSITLPC